MIDNARRQQLIQERNLIAYSFFPAYGGKMTLDVLVDTPVPFETLWQRRQSRDLNGVPVHLIDLDELILLKEYAGRLQDQKDVELLNRLRNAHD